MVIGLYKLISNGKSLGGDGDGDEDGEDGGVGLGSTTLQSWQTFLSLLTSNSLHSIIKPLSYFIETGTGAIIHEKNPIKLNIKIFTEQVGPTPESNSILKCILGTKKFLVQKNFGPKNLWSNVIT